MKTYVLNKPVLVAWKAHHDKRDEDIAEALKVHPMSFSKWLNGRTPVPLGAALELERITGIPLRRLLRERKEDTPVRRPLRRAS